MVSISSIKPYVSYDSTCILEPGCHEFVVRRSWVDYSTARIIASRKLHRGIEEKMMETRDAVDIEIFHAICKGLIESPFSKPKFQQFYLRACEAQ